KMFGSPQDVKVEELYLDHENPRVIPVAEGLEGQEALLKFMFRVEKVIELAKSIAELGFGNNNPLLVVKRQSGIGFDVLDGNRRLAAVKALLDPGILGPKLGSFGGSQLESELSPSAEYKEVIKQSQLARKSGILERLKTLPVVVAEDR